MEKNNSALRKTDVRRSGNRILSYSKTTKELNILGQVFNFEKCFWYKKPIVIKKVKYCYVLPHKIPTWEGDKILFIQYFILWWRIWVWNTERPKWE